MSGRKYSKVRLQQARALALETCAQVQGAATAVDAMILGLRQSVQTTDTKSAAFDTLLEELDSLSELIKTACNEARARLGQSNTTLQQVQTDQKEAARLVQETKKLKAKVERGTSALGERGRINALSGRLQGLRGHLIDWFPSELNYMEMQVNRLSRRLDERIRASETVESEVKELEGLETGLADLESQARQLDDQDRQRHFVLEQIENVCRETMNHRTVLRMQKDRRKPLMLDVDMGRVFGEVTFELPLEGNIRSQSLHMEQRTCEPWIENLEEALSSLGVDTAFHYENGQPVRDSYTVKPVPTTIQKTRNAQSE